MTNQLDQSEIMSFFQATVKDFAEEDNEEILGIDSSNNIIDDSDKEQQPVVTTMPEVKETTPPATASTETSNSSSNTSGGVNTQAQGFHSFFGRKGVAADLAAIHGATAGSGSNPIAREGNLRHRVRE